MIGALIAIDHAEAAHPRLLEGDRRLAAGFGQPFPFGPKQLPLAHRLAALRAQDKAAEAQLDHRSNPSEADASRPASERRAK